MEKIIGLLDKYYMVYLQGLWGTLWISAVTVLCGTLLGLLIAALRMSRSRLLNAFAGAYIEVLRGTPILLQLYFFWIGLPKLLPFELSDTMCIVVALVINASAYISEIIRAGMTILTMAFSDYVPNKVLGGLVDECMGELGAPEWTEEEYALAAQFLRTYSRTTLVGIKESLGEYFAPDALEEALQKPLDSIIHPFNPLETGYSSGSTDVGDVGYATPTVMLHVATACLGNVGHSWQNTAFSCSGIGMKGMLRAAEMLSLAALRTMAQPELLEKAKAELRRKNGGKYNCPLPEYCNPPIGRY